MPGSITRTVALALAFAATALSAVPNYPISTDVPVRDKALLNENLIPNCKLTIEYP
jgi:hypothetical protein